jgi:hypothetical protein
MHRTSDDVNDLHGAKRYLVWHSTGKHDGDTAFDNLADAEAEFDHQCGRSNVVEVELQDITVPDDPFVIKAKRP